MTEFVAREALEIHAGRTYLLRSTRDVTQKMAQELLARLQAETGAKFVLLNGLDVVEAQDGAA